MHRINWSELFYGTLGNGEVLEMRRPSATKGAILTRAPMPVVAFIKSRNRLAIPPGRCVVFKNLRETGRMQPGQPIITGYGSSKRTTTIHDHLGTDPYVTKREQTPFETFQTVAIPRNHKMGLTAVGTVRFGLEKAGSLSEKPVYRDPGVRFVRRMTQPQSSIRIPANPQIFVGIGRGRGRTACDTMFRCWKKEGGGKWDHPKKGCEEKGFNGRLDVKLDDDTSYPAFYAFEWIEPRTASSRYPCNSICHAPLIAYPISAPSSPASEDKKSNTQIFVVP